MLNSSFKLGRLAGVEIGINMSLLLVAGLLWLSLSTQIFPRTVPGQSDPIYYLLGGVVSILFFASVLWHEMAHALTARVFKIPVRQIVLNLIGGLAVMEEEAKSPTQEFWISFSGPLSSAILGSVCWFSARALGTETLIGAALLWLGQINLILAAFNMIPAFPLDGGRVFEAVIWFFSRSQLLAVRVSSVVGQIFAALFVLFAGFELMRTGSIFGSAWTLFIGWFLWSAAKYHRLSATKRNALKGVFVGQAIRSRVPLEFDWPLLYAMDRMAMGGHFRTAPVAYEDRIIGLFALESLRHVPRLSWGSVRVGQLMQPIVNFPRAAHDEEIFEVLRRMEQQESDYVVVTQQTEPIAILERLELLHFAEKLARQPA
ncbi:MAG: site-2 protease family protein [Anaerolineae bacterium]|nr:site-2 protease family protein [Anaerolineae bacterium]